MNILRLAVILGVLMVSALSSLSGQITLSTQAEVDAWDQSITELTEDLTITGDDITNIDALSNVEIISSELDVNSNPNLTSFVGLASVTTIRNGGELKFYNNDKLSSTAGLTSLQSIGSSSALVFSSNDGLEIISGFENLVDVSGTITINSNDILESITAFPMLTRVEGSISIRLNDSLKEITGFENLKQISGNLEIRGNEDLVNLNGFRKLETFLPNDGFSFNPGGSLIIESNDALLNLDGFNGLKSINGNLIIRSNESLLNIDGLSVLDTLGFEDFFSSEHYIEGNNALLNIDGLSNLSYFVGTLDVVDNRSLENIDGLSSISLIEYDVNIESNDNLLNLNGLSNLVTISERSTLQISQNNSIRNLDGLSSLDTIYGELLISSCDQLNNIDELQNIDLVSGVLARIRISNNPSLMSIQGWTGFPNLDDNGGLSLTNLNSLINIDALANWDGSSGGIVLSGNRSLTNIDAFRSITTLGGGLSISDNAQLQNINGLENIQSIGDDGNLTLSELPLLTTISPLENLAELSGILWIEYNSSLLNLEGLGGLSLLEGTLTIADNESLIDLSGLESLEEVHRDRGRLSILNNPSLITLDGLDNLQKVEAIVIIQGNNQLIEVDALGNILANPVGNSLGSISFRFNPSLSICCAFVEHLESGLSPDFYFSSNAPGCTSTSQVLEADCGLVVKYETYPPCIGTQNGSIKLYVFNYDAIPLYYSWSGSNTSTTDEESEEFDICIDNLSADIYSVTVTQPNGEAFILDDIVLDPITSPSLDILSVESTNSINGLPSGRMEVSFTGNAPPYTLSLAGPSPSQLDNLTGSSAIFDDILAGDYTLILEDANGATKSIDLKLLDESVLVSECSEPLDIIILNLVSSAISANEYGQSKDYFQTFFESVNLGTGLDDSQIAVAEWAGRNEQELKVALTGSLSELSSYADMERQFTGGTDPIEGLRFGYEYLMNNGRPNAQKVIIFTFDGCPGFSASEYCEELKEAGIIIADVGIDYVSRSSRYQTILRRAASQNNMAYFGANFEDLNPLELYVDLTVAYCPRTTTSVLLERDGSLTIDNVSATNCPYPGTIDVTFTVASLEQLSIPTGTPVSFYHNDPTSYGANLITTFLIPCPIFGGESETYTITIPVESATHLFAVLNDDGMTNPAFSLPVTDITETTYSNNIDEERICVDGFATVQALKTSVSLFPLCDDLVQYTIDLCNISTADAFGVSYVDEFAAGFVLQETVVNTNSCAIESGSTYDIPAGCCLSLLLTYDVSGAAQDYYGDQDVFLSGPSGQTYIDFDGATTTDEDVIIGGQLNCGDPIVTFTKEVDQAVACVDHVIRYTFVIDNQSSTPLYGLQFTDALPQPLEWVFRPYEKEGLSIASTDFLQEQTAIFTIDEIAAETVASFVIDVYVGDTDVEVVANNTARLDGLPSYINGGVDFLESNTVSTTILADVQIDMVDTITVVASDVSVDLSAVVSGGSTLEWSSTGDGTFSDASSLTPTYTFGPEDLQDTLIGLFLGVETYCGQKGVSVFIDKACDLSIDPIQTLEVCGGAIANTTMTWQGGVGPFDIAGRVVDTNSIDLQNIPIGTSGYIVTDALGCSERIEVTVNAIPSPESTIQIEAEHCGLSDGELILQISNGTGPYTVVGNQTWTDVVSDLTIPDLATGDYSFTVTDANGCSAELTTTLTALAGPELVESIIQPDCDALIGSASLAWIGGTGVIAMEGDFQDSDAISPVELDQLAIGDYSVTLTDAFGCTDEVMFTIDEKMSPSADLDESCIGTSFYMVTVRTEDHIITSDLGITAEPQGIGSYVLSDIPVGQAIQITITDRVNGCESVYDVLPPDCSCTAIVDAGGDQVISCYDEKVVLDASASSQGADYSSAWYDAQGTVVSTDVVFETEIAGSYTFIVEDLIFNCNGEQTVVVTDIRNTPDANILSATTVLTCEQDSLMLSAAQGINQTYTWQLSNGVELEGSELFVNEEGRVVLIVQDTISGCVAEAELTITEEKQDPLVVLADYEQLTCDRQSVIIDASASVLGSNYEVTWLDSLLGIIVLTDAAFLEVTEAGMYYVEIRDTDSGCITLESFLVELNEGAPAIALEQEYSLSCVDPEITIVPTITNDGDYLVVWSKDGTAIGAEDNLQVTEAGTYTLTTGSMATGCTAMETIVVLPPNEIEGIVMTSSAPDCFGDNTGSIIIGDIIGGTPSFAYVMNEALVSTDQMASLVAGEYALTIQDSLGCKFDTLLTLDQPDEVFLEAELSEGLITVGEDLFIELTTNVTTEDIDTVIWSPNIPCDNCLEYLIEDVQDDQFYEVTLIDDNGCEVSVELRFAITTDLSIYIPNVITTHISEETRFFPQSGNDAVVIEEMVIYDRWGNVVFQDFEFPINDPSYGWDGTVDGGQAEIGVYVYLIKMRLDDERSVEFGDVTLLR